MFRFRPSCFLRLTTVCLLVCVAATSQSQTVRPVALTNLQWSPIVEFDNQLFPAAILALATKHVEKKLPATYFGDPNGAVGITIMSPTPGAHVRVSIRVDRLSEESSIDAVITEANRQYDIFPTLRFDTARLAKVREAFPTTAVFSVVVDGVSVGEQTRTIQVRAVNDVPLAVKARNGKILDFSPLFVAFVDESHPWIDGVLKEALQWRAIQEFVGYQRTPEDVVRQVFAIWNVLQRRDLKYSSITQPSADSQAVMSQHVRFLDESVRFAQANCVDGTVLFASILYKIGLSPVLALKPGHMFLGVHLTPPSPGQRPNWIFLETTLLGNPGLNSTQRKWKFLTAQGYKDSESYRQFMNAINSGNHEFQSMLNGLNGHQPGYHVIDVARARKAGIAPISRF